MTPAEDLELFLALYLQNLVRSQRGKLELPDAQRIAKRLIANLTSLHIDALVQHASLYWQISYERGSAKPLGCNSCPHPR